MMGQVRHALLLSGRSFDVTMRAHTDPQCGAVRKKCLFILVDMELDRHLLLFCFQIGRL